MDESFLRAVDLAAACTGKIAVTGMGKSGIICKKIAATLSSTGSPAIFLHAAEAVHGDLRTAGPGRHGAWPFPRAGKPRKFFRS